MLPQTPINNWKVVITERSLEREYTDKVALLLIPPDKKN
jgi:hypothetical protein